MRFWDSSALVSLLVEEDASAACRALLRDDGDVCAWALTRVELASALRRRMRDGDLTRPALKTALARLDLLTERWTEIDAVAPVRDRAERLLATHALTAADACQLGAALVLVRDRPRRRPLVCNDERLAEAAEAEGFDVLVPSG